MAAGGEDVEGHVIDALVRILRASQGAATVPETVMGLYKADSRYKDLVKDQLGTTVVDILARHPEHFAMDADKRLVALSTGDNSAHVYSMEVGGGIERHLPDKHSGASASAAVGL